MKPKVYVETSVISYLASRPSRDVVVGARQQLTLEWWDNDRSTFDLFVSESVIKEISAGDGKAASQRLQLIEGIPLVAVTADVAGVVKALMASKVMPQKAAEDALHIALAATNGLDYLLTWNCKHIANATIRTTIDKILRGLNYQPPVICTPEELLGEKNII